MKTHQNDMWPTNHWLRRRAKKVLYRDKPTNLKEGVTTQEMGASQRLENPKFKYQKDEHRRNTAMFSLDQKQKSRKCSENGQKCVIRNSFFEFLPKQDLEKY